MSTNTRIEDDRLLRGLGRFVQDLDSPGTLHAAFLRSPHALARITAIDADAARALAGVRAVFTGAELATLPMPAVNPLVADIRLPARAPVGAGIVHAVGEPVAMVVAETRAIAQSAAESIEVDYDPLPPCADPRLSLQPGPSSPSSQPTLHLAFGEPSPDAGLESVEVALHQPRVIAMALEPRGIVARWEDERLVVYLPSQSPARARQDLAAATGLTTAQIRVVTPDVGGAFGAKASVGLEDLLVAFAAVRLREPVRWIASRSEEFLAGPHGRGAALRGQLELAADGSPCALRARMAFPLGAWLPFSASVPARNAARILPGPYRIARVDIEAAAFAGNAAPVNIYRGAGRPEAAMLLERLMDEAARRHHEDPLAYRRRHLVSADAMPHTTPTGEVLDSGDYAACLETAADRFGYTSARENQRQRRAAGEIVGIGVACYVEPCGQGWESARITAHADGSFTVASGSSAQGQGHETTFSTLAIEALGDLVSPETVIRVLQGDTDTCPPGIGALASRSVAIGGSAITLAAKRLAARLRADPDAPRPLTEECIYEAPAEAWGFGCVIAQMRVDTETGAPTIESITWADDVGRIVSPTLAHGQLIGGLAQGLGQAMMERIFYDDDGQLLTGSLMDYAVPRAADMPPVQIVGVESDAAATRANALGAKGVGEAGCIGVPAALMNAAADAVSVLPEPDAAIAALRFPLTAETLWRALHAGGHLNDDARGAAQQMEQE